MDKIKSKTLQIQQNNGEKSFFLTMRIISRPIKINSFYYYSRYNLLVEQDYVSKFQFYSINGDKLEQNIELTNYFNNLFDKKQLLFFENCIIVKSDYNLLKFSIDDLGRYESFTSDSSIYINQYTQINRKSYITHLWIDQRLRIYLLRNFKQQSTISSKYYADAITFYNYMIQVQTKQDLYYFNIQMTKQIRKYCGFDGSIHIFNSTYLFVQVFKQNNRMQQLTHIKIYNICSMKVKGTLEIKNRKYKFHSLLFIHEFDIIVVLYTDNLIDFYEFKTLQFISSEKINKGYKKEMRYDKENGLTLLQWLQIIYKIVQQQISQTNNKQINLQNSA